MELITFRQACQRLSIGRTTLWHMTKQGGFPKPVQVTPGRKAFIKAELDSWIKARAAERDWVAA